MIDSTIVSEIIDRIVSHSDPEAVLLFGSYAAGSPGQDSDLDLLIIKDSSLLPHRRSAEMRKMLIGTKVPMDILVYTRDEYETEKEKPFSFLHTALKTSKVLYERKNRAS